MTEKYSGPFTAENEARVCELATRAERRHGLTLGGPNPRSVIDNPSRGQNQHLE